MKISKSHQKFSDLLKEPRALTNPEDFLGPNWEDVINFWLYVDSLSESEISKIGDRYLALDYHVRDAVMLAARVSAEEVVGWKVRSAAWFAAWGVFGYVTYELIASHKLLEQGNSPTFLPLCLPS
jgi:hypothetical protein